MARTWAVGKKTLFLTGSAFGRGAGLPTVDDLIAYVRDVLMMPFPELGSGGKSLGREEKKNILRRLAGDEERSGQVAKWVVDLLDSAKPGEEHLALAGIVKGGGIIWITSGWDSLSTISLSRAGIKAELCRSRDELNRWYFSLRQRALTVALEASILYGRCPSCKEETPYRPDGRCPRCYEPLTPLIVAPGVKDGPKERVNRLLLKALDDLVISSVGCLVVSGLGGEWDPEVVDFLEGLGRRGKPKLCYINPEDSPISRLIEADYLCLGVKAEDAFAAISEIYYAERSKNLTKFLFHADYSLSDPIYGRIELTPLEREVLNTEVFEKLKEVRQLGLVDNYYLGAHHSRYEHSIGALCAADRIYTRLRFRLPFGREDRPEERQFVRLGALLHDVGHIPFSHLMEEVFTELGRHLSDSEFDHDLYQRQVLEKGGIREIIERHLSLYTVEDIIDLNRGRFGVAYLEKILNGPLDADKLDYVSRDSFYLGEKHEGFDLDKLTSANVVCDDLLLFDYEVVGPFSAFMLAKYNLYNDFYHSEQSRIYEAPLKKILYHFILGRYIRGEGCLEAERIAEMIGAEGEVLYNQKALIYRAKAYLLQEEPVPRDVREVVQELFRVVEGKSLLRQAYECRLTSRDGSPDYEWVYTELLGLEMEMEEKYGWSFVMDVFKPPLLYRHPGEIRLTDYVVNLREEPSPRMQPLSELLKLNVMPVAEAVNRIKFRFYPLAPAGEEAFKYLKDRMEKLGVLGEGKYRIGWLNLSRNVNCSQ
jgi:hypothetical protein